MKYFITGGAGFVGSNLVDRLIKKNKVTIYDNLSSGSKHFFAHHLKNKNFKFIKGNLLNKKLLTKSTKNHDFVIHLSANPDISRSVKEPSLDFKQGIEAAFNILEAMRLNKIKKIIYTSGSGVYGNQGLTYTKENFGPLFPTSMYGASKLAAEGLISAYCHIYDIKSWIVRPANLIGKKQTHGVGYDFIKKLKKNKKELKILGNGTQSKSYLYIDDFIDALLLITRKSKEKINLFNVASNSFIDVSSIARIVVKEMGLKNVKFQYTGGNGGWKGDVPKVRMNTKKLNKLGWKPEFTSEEAISKSIKDLLNTK